MPAGAPLLCSLRSAGLSSEETRLLAPSGNARRGPTPLLAALGRALRARIFIGWRETVQ